MVKVKNYPKYTDSKVSWIGEIPYRWDLIKIKRFVNLLNGHGFPEELQGRGSGNVPFYKVSDINKREVMLKESNNYVSFEDIEQHKWRIIKRNSIITAKIGEALKKNHRKINLHECLIDNNMMAIEVNKFDLKYIYYLLLLIDFDWYTNPGAVPSLNMKMFKNEYVAIPSVEEQRIIANFLDQKTSEIDNLIADKKRLIELLEEKRQAIITETVTKGLDPEVEMKDSRIEWLGNIPKHWKIERLKQSIKLSKNGIWGNDEQQDENDIYCIRIADFNRKNYEVDFKDGFTLRNLNQNKQKEYLLKKGDLLLEKSGGGDKQPVGFVAQYNLDETAIYANFMSKISLYRNKADSNFFKYLFGTLYLYRVNIRSIKQTTGIQNLDTSLYFNEKIPLPPIEEQKRISKYIYEELKKIDEVINDIQIQINRLKEYRQSLIYEAVTGKIDVRDYPLERKEEAHAD